MNSRLVSFQMGHLDFFEHDEIDTVKKNVLGFCQYNKVDIYTVIHNNKPIAIFYVNELEKGVGLVWATMSKNIKRNMIGIHKMAKMALLYAKRLGYIKLQALVDADFCIGRNWLFSLGFQEEGRLEHYGTWKKARYLYGKVL